MHRFLIAGTAAFLAAAMAGCAARPHCNDCCGYGNAGYMPTGPLDAALHWRRSLTCGAGCGETYYGEWTSTPPDCCDPCPTSDCGCGDSGCGGCGPRPRRMGRDGCGIRPLRATARLVAAIYGKRMCGIPCGDCGSVTGNCGCDGAIYDTGSGEGFETMHGAPAIGPQPGCNCGGQAPTSAGRMTMPGSSRVTAMPPGANASPLQMARMKQRSATSQMNRSGIPPVPSGTSVVAEAQSQPQPDLSMRSAQRLPQHSPPQLRR